MFVERGDLLAIMNSYDRSRYEEAKKIVEAHYSNRIRWKNCWPNNTGTRRAQHQELIRTSVCHELQKRGLAATPQATTAIVQTISRTPPGRVGDSDSLLLGLLFSGSYTIDVLEQSGANPHDLLTNVLFAEQPSLSIGSIQDRVDEFFDRNNATPTSDFLNAMRRKRPIECADIMRTALAPSCEYDVIKTMVSKGAFKKAWESLYEESLSVMLNNIGLSGDIRRLKGRRGSLRPDEREAIGEFFQDEHVSEIFSIAISSVFGGRTMNFAELGREFPHLRDGLPMAAGMFVDDGGDPLSTWAPS